MQHKHAQIRSTIWNKKERQVFTARNNLESLCHFITLQTVAYNKMKYISITLDNLYSANVHKLKY